MRRRAGISFWVPRYLANDNWTTAGGRRVANRAPLEYVMRLLELRKVQGQLVEVVRAAGGKSALLLACDGAALPALPDEDWDTKRRSVDVEIHAKAEEAKVGVCVAALRRY